MSPIALALASITAVLHVADAQDVDPSLVQAMTDDLKRAIDRTEHTSCLVDPLPSHPCVTQECLADLVARHAGEQVILLRIIGGASLVRVIASRFDERRVLTSSSSADLALSPDMWSLDLDRLANAIRDRTPRSAPPEQTTVKHERSSPLLRPPFILAAASSAIALGLGIYFADQRQIAHDRLSTPGAVFIDQSYEAEESRLRNSSIGAMICFGLAAVAAIATTAILVLSE
jgi:hypothetical protein